MVTWWGERATRAQTGQGPTWVHQGPRGKKDSIFPKLFLDHLGCSNKCFWPDLSRWWPGLALRKCQNALKMGLENGTKNWSKMGQKRFFLIQSKIDPRPLGVLMKRDNCAATCTKWYTCGTPRGVLWSHQCMNHSYFRTLGGCPSPTTASQCYDVATHPKILANHLQVGKG